MHNPPGVTIDAGVLAVPKVDCARDDAYRYVNTLLDWSKLLNRSWVAIYMSERASMSLVEDQLFPVREQLKNMFCTHGIIEYDFNTVARIANQLLTNTPYFETYYRVEDVLSEHLETYPDVIRKTTHDDLQSDLARCITLIAILRKHCSQPLGGHSLILRKVPKQVIQVRAHIYDIEHSRDDIPALPSPPEFFEGDVLACDDFRGLIECLDESAILVGASDDAGVELAVRIALFKKVIAEGDSPNWEGEIVPVIGSSFRESCQQVCSDQGDSIPPKILRSIVETVKGYKLSAVHALRKGPGGNDRQVTRGKDKAQRRAIGRSLRLHYWECAKGKVELASVACHDDYSIPN